MASGGYIPSFNSGEDRLVSWRFCTARLAAYSPDLMVVTAVGQVDLALALLSHECTALRCSAGGRICDSNERKRSTEDENRGACAICRTRAKGIAFLVSMIAHGGHDEVRAVDSDHSTLGEPRAWIVFLDNGVDTEEGNDDGKGEIKRDEKLVECTARACEVRVQHASHGKGCHIHARGRTDKNPLPELGVAGILPFLETSLRPGVGKVHQEN
jgi:hypothetical protein